MKIHHPEGHSSLSFGGVHFAVGPDGAFDVPREAALEIVGLGWGFVHGAPEPSPAAPVATEAELLDQVTESDVDKAEPEDRAAAEAALEQLPAGSSAADRHEAVEKALAAPLPAVQDAAAAPIQPRRRRR